MKDAGLRIRVAKKLRVDFVVACNKLDISAAQVIRQHMRDVVKKIAKKNLTFKAAVSCCYESLLSSLIHAFFKHNLR